MPFRANTEMPVMRKPRMRKPSIRKVTFSAPFMLVCVTIVAVLLAAYQTIVHSQLSQSSSLIDSNPSFRRLGSHSFNHKQRNAGVRTDQGATEGVKEGLKTVASDSEHEVDEDDEDKGSESQEQVRPFGWSWDDDSNYVNNLWHGRPTTLKDGVLLDPHRLELHGVLSYCLGDLGQVLGYVAGYHWRTFTLISKCGIIPNIDLLPTGAQVIQMDNVGRIDHTVAHWMVQATASGAPWTGKEIIVFLKDNINVHAHAVMRSFENLLNYTSIDGFGCALEPRRGKSFFHLTEILSTFKMEEYVGVTGGRNSPINDVHDVTFKSKYQNMGAWLRDMEISLPIPLTPVCYGGNFAAQMSQILKVPHRIWTSLEHSLSRGDNIEEGHFAERTWAGLLYRSVTVDERELLFQRTNGISHLNEEMRGALLKG